MRSAWKQMFSLYPIVSERSSSLLFIESGMEPVRLGLYEANPCPILCNPRNRHRRHRGLGGKS
jgi:hypothetical protein